MRKGACYLASFLIWAISIAAQTSCPPPALQPISPQVNFFTDPQESDLGDAMAESLSRELRVVDDAALSAHLRALGEHLVHYLPPNQFRFRFSLMDFPQVNAFSFAGGRDRLCLGFDSSSVRRLTLVSA